MDAKDRTYENLIRRVRAAAPPPDDPQGLSAEILRAVGRLPDRPETNGVLKAVSRITTAAAVLLIGVFLSEYPAPALSPTPQADVSAYRVHALPQIDPDGDITREQINGIIRERIISRKNRKAFYANLIKKHRTF